jgi:hypothetical protein
MKVREYDVDAHSVQSDVKPYARLKRVMETYKCDAETAYFFIDLRDDGHGLYQAEVMSGLRDPSY